MCSESSVSLCFLKVGSVVDHKFLLFYTYLVIVMPYFYRNTETIHSSTGSTTYRLPHVLVSRVASDRVLGSAGFRLNCKYKRLVWPVYTMTTRGSLLLRGRWGPLWAVAVRSRRSGFLRALQFPRSSTSPRGCSGGDRFYACA